ncbi:polyphosphate polymerase domain-containing protein [Mobilitalea sibirica]|uniref:Polyphosphate polymerase domain-containing protein n=1 Tax=Mobilitalea sibirica TaxID=1462919 RepID=A0A8J7HE27_9FIRM|nr:polyphosphate polymerase domain-containing protein [Mobilitalea sibirica]MBH1941524.1 polyphosphate polymerase domain-containing protein [Mobilitalea sibirica]
MKYQNHKLRHELKYYITDEVYRTLRERFRYLLKPDENMVDEEGYLISSLYFDDVFHSALEQKVNGTRFRRKYRIRIYDRSDNIIKLECKSKFDSFIAKESATLNREEYNRILNDEYDFLLNRKEAVCKELYAYHNSRLLAPVTVVEYLREAYVSDLGNVRITFDKNISASLFSLDMFGEEYETMEVLPQGLMVLEVKYDDFIPKYIWDLIQISKAQKCAISKYVMCRKLNRRVTQV